MSASKWKPYPEYKDTEYSWMGKIPKHWEVSRVKHLFESSKERFSEDNPQILSLTQRGIIKRDISNFGGQIAATYDGYHRVNIGDIVFNPMDLRSGFVDASPFTGIISPAYTIVKAKVDLSKKFYSRWFQRHYLEGIFWPYGSGVSYEHRWTLGNETLLNFPVVKPPIDEQQEINKMIERIVRYTTLLESQLTSEIELLNEKRSVLITRAVSKGLNPNVTMKDSGIEWVGEFPQHWTKVKLSHLSTKIGDGLHGTPKYVDQSDYRFINGNNLVDSQILFKDSTKFVSYEEYQKHHISLDYSSLILSINGTIGVSAFYNGEKVILGKSAAYINCNMLICREFLHQYIQSAFIQNWMQMVAGGTTIPNLSLESIRNMPILCPPIEEQHEIFRHLEALEKIFSSIKIGLMSKIERLKEYRTSLISAAVTGKIDVRSL